MFQVNTPDGPRYMVVLVVPKSYRLGSLHVMRGGVLTVTRKTRDYLVKRTGFFADYDPMPAEPIEEVLPPQFGMPRGDVMDLSEFDPKRNPPLTQAEAAALAAHGSTVNQNGVTVNEDGEEEGAYPKANPAAFKDDTSGDMTAKDLKKGGSLVGSAPAPASKKGGYKATGGPAVKATPEPLATGAEAASEGTITVS